MYEEAPCPTEVHGIPSAREPSAFHHPNDCYKHTALETGYSGSPNFTLVSKGMVLFRLVVPTPMTV